MNVNSLTIKAQEALQAAYTLAQQRGQQAIEPLHMLSVLIRDDDALCTFLLGRVGVNVRGLRGRPAETCGRYREGAHRGDPHLPQGGDRRFADRVAGVQRIG